MSLEDFEGMVTVDIQLDIQEKCNDRQGTEAAYHKKQRHFTS